MGRAEENRREFLEERVEKREKIEDKVRIVKL